MRAHLAPAIVVLALGFAPPAFAQDVAIRPKLAVGQQFQLTVTRSREESARPERTTLVTHPVDVRVISAGRDGYVLGWRPGPGLLTGGVGVGQNAAAELAAKALGDVEFQIALDADGAFDKLANADEIVPKIKTLTDYMIREAEKNISAEEVKRYRELSAQILSPAVLMDMVTRDAQHYVSMFGAELAPKDTIEVPLEQPNPFGGDPLPATLRVRLDSLSGPRVTLSSTLTYDSKAMAKATLGLLERASDKPAPAEVAAFRLEITDEGKYLYDRTLGLFREVTMTRRVVTTDGKMSATITEKSVLTLTSEPKR